MPNITVYVPKDVFVALEKRPDIKKSKVATVAFKKALTKEKKS